MEPCRAWSPRPALVAGEGRRRAASALPRAGWLRPAPPERGVTPFSPVPPDTSGADLWSRVLRSPNWAPCRARRCVAASVDAVRAERQARGLGAELRRPRPSGGDRGSQERDGAAFIESRCRRACAAGSRAGRTFIARRYVRIEAYQRAVRPDWPQFDLIPRPPRCRQRQRARATGRCSRRGCEPMAATAHRFSVLLPSSGPLADAGRSAQEHRASPRAWCELDKPAHTQFRRAPVLGAVPGRSGAPRSRHPARAVAAARRSWRRRLSSGAAMSARAGSRRGPSAGRPPAAGMLSAELARRVTSRRMNMGCCGQNPVGAAPSAVDACKRVNYALGMLLGVDDFVQESAYHTAPPALAGARGARLRHRARPRRGGRGRRRQRAARARHARAWPGCRRERRSASSPTSAAT